LGLKAPYNSYDGDVGSVAGLKSLELCAPDFLAGAVINLLVYRDQKNAFLLIWTLVFVLVFLVLLYHLQLNLNANIKYTWHRG